MKEKQTPKPSKDELASVKEYRMFLAEQVERVRKAADRVNAWLEVNEPKLDTLIAARKYSMAVALLGRAPEAVVMALDLDGDISGCLLDAEDESILQEPEVRCEACGQVKR
jgi:hypothetical protein